MVFNWKEFLAQFNQDLLNDEIIRNKQSPDVLASGWLGYSGAKEEEIIEVEKRLNVTLPPSYKTFLLESNGWRDLDYFIYNLYSTNEICWFVEKNQFWADAWNTSEITSTPDEKYFIYGEKQDTVWMRPEYLYSALQVSSVGDDAVCLLNPNIIFKNGEWEAWIFSNWYPGARRYRSFQEMMENMYTQFLRISKHDKDDLPKNKRCSFFISLGKWVELLIHQMLIGRYKDLKNILWNRKNESS